MISKEEKKQRIKRLFILILIIIGIIGLVLGLYFGFGLNKEFENEEALREHIKAYGNYSRVFYVLINFIQTTLIPITNYPTIIAGSKIFTPWETTILTIIAVLLGSITTFTFGKMFGKKAVYWILGKETVDKYLNMAKGREKYVIFFMLLLPGFPDDIICLVAGITSMSWLFFVISILITRTIPIMMIVFLGEAIPLKGWGLVLWIAIFLVIFLIGRYVFKNWDKVNHFIDRLKRKKDKLPK